MESGKSLGNLIKRLSFRSWFYLCGLIASLTCSADAMNIIWSSISKPNQVTDSVHGLVGENVLLTCVYTNDFPLPENVTVFWYQKDKPVFYILDGVPSDEYQDQMFTGRVLSFPDQYKEQNFSIILKNIQLSDSGFYDCFIPMVGFKSQVHLIVSGAVKLTTTVRSPSNDTMIVTLSLVVYVVLNVILILGVVLITLFSR